MLELHEVKITLQPETTHLEIFEDFIYICEKKRLNMTQQRNVIIGKK